MTMHMTVAHNVGRVVDDSTITVNGKAIKIVSNRDPLQLPWGEMVRILGRLPFTSLSVFSCCMQVAASRAATILKSTLCILW